MSANGKTLLQVLETLEALPMLCEGMTFPSGPWRDAREALSAAVGGSPRSGKLAEALKAWESLETPREGLVFQVGPWNRARESAIEAIRHHLTASGLHLRLRADRVAAGRSDIPSTES